MRERLSWVQTTEELEALFPEWSALWRQDGHATPFQAPEWLVPWWHCFGGDLRTVCICDDNALIGLLPFYIYREPHKGERQLLSLGVGTSDYLDGVFSPRCDIEFIQKAADFMCRDDGWDTLYVWQLRAGSKLLQALQFSARKVEGQSCSRMPAVTVPELPQKLRRNAMYYRNRAQRAGHLEFVIGDASTWAEIFAALIRLQGERWGDRGETGVFADERMIRWHREALPLLERAGLLRLCALRLNGEIIAVSYSLIDAPGHSDRTQYIYLPAFSTAYADLRPGTILTAMAIEHAAREGVQTIDMLRGDEDYKKLWHTQPVPTFGLVRRREQEQQAGKIAA
jgi:CelD/BcsL family acetyltransferase involved in cellulose biosynthesis